jgi:hypothetical protein
VDSDYYSADSRAKLFRADVLLVLVVGGAAAAVSIAFESLLIMAAGALIIVGVAYWWDCEYHTKSLASSNPARSC